MNELNKTLCDNPKGRMILMLAVADRCKKVVDLSFRDEYANNIAKCVTAVRFSLTDTDKEMFSQTIADGLKKVSDVLNNPAISVDDKIIKLGAAIEREMTHECRVSLESFIKVSEISILDCISATEASQLVLWMVVSQILEDYTLCRVVLQDAYSYRPQKQQTEKKTLTKSLTTNDVLEKIHAGKLDTDELYKQACNVADAMQDYLIREYEITSESIENGKKIKDAKVAADAVKLKKKLSCSETDHMIALLKDHITNGNDTSDTKSITASILYSEVVYAIGNFLSKVSDKTDFVLKILELPETFHILVGNSSVINNIDLEKVEKELAMLFTIGEAMTDERTATETFTIKYGRCTKFVRQGRYIKSLVPNEISSMPL